MLKHFIDSIDFSLCPKLRKKVSYFNIAEIADVVIGALWKQFGIDLKSGDKDYKKYSVTDFTMTVEAKKQFEEYYHTFFKSKFFRFVALEYILNYEPKILEDEHGTVSKAGKKSVKS
jgi:hypothetical protein